MIESLSESRIKRIKEGAYIHIYIDEVLMGHIENISLSKGWCAGTGLCNYPEMPSEFMFVYGFLSEWDAIDFLIKVYNAYGQKNNP